MNSVSVPTFVTWAAAVAPGTATRPERPAFDNEGNLVLRPGQRVVPALRAMSADGRFVLLPNACVLDTNLVCPDLPLDGSIGTILHDRDADEDGRFDEDGETMNRTIAVPPDGGNAVGLSRIFMSPDASSISYLGTRGFPSVATLFLQRISHGIDFRREITEPALRVGKEWNGPLSEILQFFFAGPHTFWVYSSANNTIGPGYRGGTLNRPQLYIASTGLSEPAASLTEKQSERRKADTPWAVFFIESRTRADDSRPSPRSRQVLPSPPQQRLVRCAPPRPSLSLQLGISS